MEEAAPILTYCDTDLPAFFLLWKVAMVALENQLPEQECPFYPWPLGVWAHPSNPPSHFSFEPGAAVLQRAGRGLRDAYEEKSQVNVGSAKGRNLPTNWGGIRMGVGCALIVHTCGKATNTRIKERASKHWMGLTLWCDLQPTSRTTTAFGGVSGVT